MNYEQRQAVIECLNRAQLSSAKVVTVCLHISGWTQEEIGQVLGLDRTTVCYHWTDALDQMWGIARELGSE